MSPVTSLTRSSLMPENCDDFGDAIPGFERHVCSYGLAAPAGTPRPIIDAQQGNAPPHLSENCAPLAIEGAEPLQHAEKRIDIDREETQWSKV